MYTVRAIVKGASEDHWSEEQGANQSLGYYVDRLDWSNTPNPYSLRDFRLVSIKLIDSCIPVYLKLIV